MAQVKILVVEDEIITAENIKDKLTELGYQVPLTVDTGEEAIQQAETLAPDLVLMDIQLAGEMDGVTAAEQIRTRLGIPVIYLTAYADDVVLKRAKHSEPFGYLLKPYRVDALRTAIEMALYKHQLDEKLKRSEASYRAMVEDQTELICRFLPDGALAFVNGPYCRYQGQAYEDLLGKNFLEIFPQDDWPAIRAQLAALDRQNPVASHEHHVVTPSGEDRWQHWTIHAILDDQAQVVEFQAVGRDITKRRQAEEQIRQQNQFLNHVLESLPHPFYVIDAHDYTIQLANSAAGLDRQPGAITCYALTHRLDQPCTMTDHPCPLAQIKESKRSVMVEHVHYDANGDLRNFEVHAHPIFDGEGNVVRVIEYALDITERKQVEAERQKLLVELQDALARIKTLSGLLPICASCKKIRDDKGYWTQVEVYIRDHSEARFSHGICPGCAKELYPEIYRGS